MGRNKRKGGPRPGITNEQRAEETRQMLLMKQAGGSYRAIAKHFGLDTSAVWHRIQNELKNVPLPEATELRALEILKLDEYEKRLQTQISEGDTKAIQTAIRISERRCRMLGLDMPIRNEVQISATEQKLATELIAAVNRAAGITQGEP